MQKRILAAILASTFTGALAGCGSAEPVGDSKTAQNTPAAERVEEVNWGAQESASDDTPGQADNRSAESGGANRWVYKPESKMAVFGPPNSEALLAIQCTGDGNVTVTRYTPATQGAARMLTFKGENNIASVAVSGESIELSPGLVWQGSVSAGDGELRRALSGKEGTVMAEIAGSSPLSLPVGEEPLKAIDACS